MSKWWDQSWNTLIGCSHASPGCQNCYAEQLAGTRLKHLPNYKLTTTGGKWNGHVERMPHKLEQPLRWRKPRRIFVNDMSDTFHPEVPFEFIAAMYGVMAACPQHTFILLTKRPERMLEFYEWIAQLGESRARIRMGEDPKDPRWAHYACTEMAHAIMGGDAQTPHYDHRVGWPFPNVWTGTTVEDQKRADERIPTLIQVPSVVRFLSVEPLLSDINLGLMGTQPAEWTGGAYRMLYQDLHWVIAGGESGHRARQCDRKWLEYIERQCRAAGVPCYIKQLGACYADTENAVGGRYSKVPSEYGSLTRRLKDVAGRDMAEWPESLRVRQYPEAT